MAVAVPSMTINPWRWHRAHLFIVGAVVIDAENPFNTADHAADRAANNRADRAGPAIALIEAVRNAAGDATLRVRCYGQCHGGDSGTGNENVDFHELTSRG